MPSRFGLKDSPLMRIRILSAGLTIIALILVARLYQVQILQGDVFVAKAERQYVLPRTSAFDRGTIYFTTKDDKRISAATLQAGYTLAINPTALTEPSDTYNVLSSVVEVDESAFFEKSEKVSDPYEVLAKDLTQEQADTIVEFDLTGVQLSREQSRYYPGNTLAAQTIGFVGYQGDELAGRYGLERYYNDVLERDEEDVYVNFFAEVFSNLSNAFADSTPGDGDVVLTIEPTVQKTLEQELAALDEIWGSQGSGGVIINPHTGAVFALGTTPNFDLNAFSTVDDTSVFGNPLVENVYEMGSIIKPLTVAAGLDAGVITAKTTYNDQGSATYGIATISNYDGRARGVVPMQEVLSQSLNTGVAFIVDRLGNETFAEYLKAFGVGEETGVDLPGEVPGLITNLESPREIEYRTASFGQGIALTPIATVRALAALANGGKLITPHVVKEISYDIRPSKKIFYDPDGEVISKEASEEITRMLVAVVDDALAGGNVSIPSHSVAAKTGTAQIAAPDGGYYDDRFFHSFFGYFPAYDPEFLIFLYTEEPRGVRFASETLTEPFFNLIDFLITYYEVPGDREIG